MPIPQPREIWIVEDLEVRLHSEGRVDKRGRPVLVMTSKALTRPEATIINAIPLTTSNAYDELTFPIARAYESTEPGFTPDKKSAALIQFYQPIEIKYFKKKCGLICKDVYWGIRHTLCMKVIGEPDYDFC